MTNIIVWSILIVLMWVVLLVTLLLARRFVDMCLPPLGGFLWRSAVVVAVSESVGMLSMGLGLLSLVLGVIAFMLMAMKLLYLDGHQAGLLALSFWAMRMLALTGLVALLE